MQLTQEQQKKLKKVAKLVDFKSKGATSLLEYLFELDDKYSEEIPEIKELIDELKKDRPDREEIKEMVADIIGGIKIPEAIHGEKGDKGDSYILTNDDKNEIASKIQVPVVEKVIEKTTESIVREQPIEIIKEVAVVTDADITSRSFAVRDALEIIVEDEDKLKIDAIQNLRKELDEVKKIGAEHRVIGANRNLYQLLDVDVSGITTDQSIKWDGTKWVAYTPSGGGGTWGSITGTLSDQTDLQSALDAKLTKTDPNYLRTLTSGVISGCVVSRNVDTTKFDISAGTFLIVDCWTNPTVPVAYPVTYAGSTANTVTNLATADFSNIGLDKNGTIIQQTTEFDASDRREYVELAQLGHTDRTNISGVVPSQEIAVSPVQQLRDVMSALGIINNGNELSANGVNLSINRAVGRFTGEGILGDATSPYANIVSFNAVTAPTIRHRTQIGAGVANSAFLDVGNYDVGGTLTALSGTKYTNQRVYMFANGNIVVQYGQAQYNSMGLAVGSINSEVFVPFSNVAEKAVLIGVITVRSTATDLSDTAQATFSAPPSGGSVGAVVPTLQGVYENSTPNPEIITDTTNGAVTLRRGTASDTDTVFDIQNGAGSSTFSVKGNGGITGDTLTLSDMTAGSVMFAGTGGLLSQDNRGIFWDNTNKIFNTAASYGANYITNGDFTGSATGWTLGAGWVYSSNSVSKTSDGLSSLQQGITIQANSYVELNFTVSNLTVGNVTVACGGITQSAITTAGTYKFRFITTNNTGLTFAPSNTARLTIDAVSMYPYTGGGIRTSGAGYFGDRLTISRANSNYSTGTGDHLNLANRTGSNTNLTFTFGSSALGIINANSSGVLTHRATAYHQWYVGAIDSGTQAAYFDTAGIKTTGGVYSATKIIAGSVNTSTPATIGLSSNGAYAGRGITVFTPITLTAAYQYVYADTTIAQACGGTTGIVCSSYTGNVACNDKSGIGCSWSGGYCIDLTDEETCDTWSPQCGWTSTADCSDFNANEGACTTTSGCTANYDGDCTAFGDETACTAQSGCTWDGGCTGMYYTSCSGTYDIEPYCAGTEYGTCNGTASCSNVTDETECTTTYSPCTWSEILQLTLPTFANATSGNMGLEYYIKKVGGTGTVKILAQSGDKIDGANDYSITTTNQAIHLHAYPLYESCLQYSSYGSCIAVGGCSWGSDPCSAYEDDGTCTSNGCSWDSDSNICYGTTGSCTGSVFIYNQWNILSNKN